MLIPSYLKHKPILEVPDYDKIDGQYSEGGTDAVGLSIGIAQWNAPGDTDISVKIWRNKGNRWLRMSEELPVHRALDLAYLVCVALEYDRNDDKVITTHDFPVNISIGNENFLKHAQYMKKEFKKNKKHLELRLKRLSEYLKKLGY